MQPVIPGMTIQMPRKTSHRYLIQGSQTLSKMGCLSSNIAERCSLVMIHDNLVLNKSKGIMDDFQDLATAILDAVNMNDIRFLMCPSTGHPSGACFGDFDQNQLG